MSRYRNHLSTRSTHHEEALCGCEPRSRAGGRRGRRHRPDTSEHLGRPDRHDDRHDGAEHDGAEHNRRDRARPDQLPTAASGSRTRSHRWLRTARSRSASGRRHLRARSGSTRTRSGSVLASAMASVTALISGRRHCDRHHRGRAADRTAVRPVARRDRAGARRDRAGGHRRARRRRKGGRRRAGGERRHHSGQADQKLAELADRITAMVNGELPAARTGRAAARTWRARVPGWPSSHERQLVPERDRRFNRLTWPCDPTAAAIRTPPDGRGVRSRRPAALCLPA